MSERANKNLCLWNVAYRIRRTRASPGQRSRRPYDARALRIHGPSQRLANAAADGAHWVVRVHTCFSFIQLNEAR